MYLSTITLGSGFKCSLSKLQISVKLFDVGGSGVHKSLINLYVSDPTELKNMAFFLPSSVMSLAFKIEL